MSSIMKKLIEWLSFGTSEKMENKAYQNDIKLLRESRKKIEKLGKSISFNEQEQTH